MRQQTFSILLSAFLLGTAACNQSPDTSDRRTRQPVATAPVSTDSAQLSQPASASNIQPAAFEKPKTDACALISSDEIKTVQGEPVKETKLTARSDGGFSISQCFFTLPTFTNSISLAVTQEAEGKAARDPKAFWRETFHEGGESKRERERERERGSKDEGEEEEEVEAERIRGLGDEAFWMGSRVGGALYVLKGNSYLRLSIGGTGDQASRVKRLKTLAQKALGRM